MKDNHEATDGTEWPRPLPSYMVSELECKVAEYADKYFDDMRLAIGSVAEKYLWLYYTDGHKEYSLPTEWNYQLDANNYQYIVDIADMLPEGIAGQTDHTKYTVTIAPEHENDDIVLLHEMIHVYEGLYNYMGDPPMYGHYGEIQPVVFPFIRDALLISLYNDLKCKIVDLDERILKHANIHSGVKIAVDGGNHDILFFLKSLDLDLRKDYQLGTVCGYGRELLYPKN